MNKKEEGQLSEFLLFCEEHPELRFWQALLIFVEGERIEVDGDDTFYWKSIRGK